MVGASRASLARTARIGAVATLLALPAVLAFYAGGFFLEPKLWAAGGAMCVAAGALLLAPEPLPRSAPGRLCLLGLAGLTAWAAASIAWAPEASPAFDDFVQLALYLAVLVAAAALIRGPALQLAVEPALAAGILAVSCYALATRYLPGLVPSTESWFAGGRLEQPLTYWNALGALAAIGVVLSLRIASDAGRAAALRAAAAVALPAPALALYLTLSRGAMVALVAGLAVLIVLARDRRTGWAALAAIALVVVAALVAPAVETGRSGEAPAFERTPGGIDLPRDARRLRTVQTNRTEYWRVALDGFAERPVAGHGGGAFEPLWRERRRIEENVSDAHSLPLETLVELGLAGAGLLALFLGGAAAAAVRLVRAGPAQRALAAGWIAASVTFLVHAAVDWTWEMPAVALVFVLLAGATLAAAGDASERRA